MIDLSRDELEFWVGLFRDHAVFLRDNLGPSEVTAVAHAESLLKRLEADPTTDCVIAAISDLLTFTRELLARLLACKVVIHVPPSALMEMIDEEVEFLRRAGVLPEPPMTPAMQRMMESPIHRLLHLHHLWLSNAAAHSALIAATLDPHEKPLIREFMCFEAAFNELVLKVMHQMAAHHLIMQDFNAVRLLTRDAVKAVEAHVHALECLRALAEKCEVETTAPPLLYDHFIREERFYLDQVAAIDRTEPRGI